LTEVKISKDSSDILPNQSIHLFEILTSNKYSYLRTLEVLAELRYNPSEIPKTRAVLSSEETLFQGIAKMLLKNQLSSLKAIIGAIDSHCIVVLKALNHDRKI